MSSIDLDSLDNNTKIQCPKCAENGGDKSQDNLHFYSKEFGAFCFKCGFTIPSKEYVSEGKITKGGKVLITKKDENKLKSKALTPEQLQEVIDKTVPRISVKYRGMDNEVCQELGVRWEVDENGKPTAMYFPTTIKEDGKDVVVGYKIRRHPKDFYSIGYVGKLNGFLGQNKAIAETLIVVEGECFTEDTEVMTDRGFVKFPDLLESDLILQVDEDLRGAFVKPLARVKKKYDGDLIYQKTSTTNSLTTPNHRLVFKDRFGSIFKQKAREHVNTNWSIPKHVLVNGKGTGLSKDEIKLVIAICADGSLRKRVEGSDAVHFGFMKERKIKRLKGVLSRLNIPYSFYVNTYQNGKTYTTFNFRMPDYLKTKELPREWIVDATLDERLFILEEIRYWDGHYQEKRGSTEFTSKHYSEVSYIQELAHTSGKYASVARRRNKFGEWYRCVISDNNFNTSTQKLTSEVVNHKGYVYCVTVPTGMILTRHEGRIMVNGNCDLITAIGAMENGDKYRKSYNVVTSPLGADSTEQIIKLNYDWVDAHKKIIVCLDNDEAGEKAFEKVRQVVDNSKLFKSNLRHKDLNDYLKAGDADKIPSDLYWNATPVKSFGIAGSGDIFDAIMETVNTETIALPPFLSDLQPVFKGGIPLGEILTIAAASSVGKSAITNEIILDWIMNSPHKLLVLTFEDTIGTFGAKIASRVSGHNILAMDSKEDKIKVLEKYKDEIDKYLYTESGENRFNIVDAIPEKISELKEMIIQSIKVYGSKVIVIDPVSSIMASKSNEEQADFMNFLELLKREYGVSILQSIHTRKSASGQKDKGEGASFSEDDVRGSSTIIGTSTIVVLLSRDKMNPDPIERNTTKISVSKNRTYSITGRDIAKIYYSPEHHTLFAHSYAEKHNFFRGMSAEEMKKVLDSKESTNVVTKTKENLEDDLNESLEVF